MRRLRHNRLVALVALLALCFATTAYVSHGFTHKAGTPPAHKAAQCDVCLQLNGSAGVPDAAGVACKPPLVARVPVASTRIVFSSRRHVSHRLPRAPPAFHLS